MLTEVSITCISLNCHLWYIWQSPTGKNNC